MKLLSPGFYLNFQISLDKWMIYIYIYIYPIYVKWIVSAVSRAILKSV